MFIIDSNQRRIVILLDFMIPLMYKVSCSSAPAPRIALVGFKSRYGRLGCLENIVRIVCLFLTILNNVLYDTIPQLDDDCFRESRLDHTLGVMSTCTQSSHGNLHIWCVQLDFEA